MTIVSRKEANGKALAKNKPNRDQLAQTTPTRSEWSSSRLCPRSKTSSIQSCPSFLTFPIAAIRSPPIPVEANNLIRISVLVKRPYASAGGLGGIIVRDSIGGEQFQYRTSGAIAAFSRVVLFRKAPAAGTFTVTLGLAGYAEAYFDDFRVEVIEEGDGREDDRANAAGPGSESTKRCSDFPPAARSDNTRGGRAAAGFASAVTLTPSSLT